eukprot:TRINITY_DN5530_c0_g1_i4.p1 TRINITY_DN5530_c0_g1~~TRINITY_DN5530_c0_g1_i4.p1  ORF type:complete len:402 (+),score=69.79 TRINITY_DN5530_c0_g1_i4:66-1271(+)
MSNPMMLQQVEASHGPVTQMPVKVLPESLQNELMAKTQGRSDVHHSYPPASPSHDRKAYDMNRPGGGAHTTPLATQDQTAYPPHTMAPALPPRPTPDYGHQGQATSFPSSSGYNNTTAGSMDASQFAGGYPGAYAPPPPPHVAPTAPINMKKSSSASIIPSAPQGFAPSHPLSASTGFTSAPGPVGHPGQAPSGYPGHGHVAGQQVAVTQQPYSMPSAPPSGPAQQYGMHSHTMTTSTSQRSMVMQPMMHPSSTTVNQFHTHMYPGGMYPAQSTTSSYTTYGSQMMYAQTPYMMMAPPPTYVYEQAFVVPSYIPLDLHDRMMEASMVFRMFDYNMSGRLSRSEWKQALRHMGYVIPKGHSKWLFYQIDTNHTGFISEWEFCNWWICFNPTTVVYPASVIFY